MGLNRRLSVKYFGAVTPVLAGVDVVALFRRNTGKNRNSIC